jgi:hypothetical protein
LKKEELPGELAIEKGALESFKFAHLRLPWIARQCTKDADQEHSLDRQPIGLGNALPPIAMPFFPVPILGAGPLRWQAGESMLVLGETPTGQTGRRVDRCNFWLGCQRLESAGVTPNQPITGPPCFSVEPQINTARFRRDTALTDRLPGNSCKRSKAPMKSRVLSVVTTWRK